MEQTLVGSRLADRPYRPTKGRQVRTEAPWLLLKQAHRSRDLVSHAKKKLEGGGEARANTDVESCGLAYLAACFLFFSIAWIGAER